MRVFFLTLALLLGSSLGLPGTARATLLKGLSLDDLCQRSGVILRGEVVSRAASWKGGRIYTRVTLRVKHSLRGAHRAGQTVSFWRLGGKVGRHVQLVRGSPTFRRGQRVLLFLSRRGSHLFVTGMAQGRFALRQTTSGAGTTTVTQPLAGARLFGTLRALRKPTPLSQFERRIRASLATLKRRAP